MLNCPTNSPTTTAAYTSLLAGGVPAGAERAASALCEEFVSGKMLERVPMMLCKLSRKERRRKSPNSLSHDLEMLSSAEVTPLEKTLGLRTHSLLAQTRLDQLPVLQTRLALPHRPAQPLRNLQRSQRRQMKQRRIFPSHSQRPCPSTHQSPRHRQRQSHGRRRMFSQNHTRLCI